MGRSVPQAALVCCWFLGAASGIIAPAPSTLAGAPPTARRLLWGTPTRELGLLLGTTKEARRADEYDKARGVYTALRQGFDLLGDGEEACGPVSARTRRMLRSLDWEVAPSFEVVALQRAGEAATAESMAKKLLVTLRDGETVETVLLRSAKSSSVCVSSQVGCRMACRFCATGTMSERRSLEAAEIVAQVCFAARVARQEGWAEVKNIVFMGMGEPMNNVAAVRAALAIITARDGLCFSRRCVVVSTVAPSRLAIADMATLTAKMAFSLHSAVDEKRKLLVPTATDGVRDLQAAWLEALEARPPQFRELIIEATLVDGVNDGAADAKAMAAWLEPFLENHRGNKVLVNLIPMNPTQAAPFWRASPLATTRAFQRILWDRGVWCTIRETKGDDDAAACGQLATAKTPRLRKTNDPPEQPALRTNDDDESQAAAHHTPPPPRAAAAAAAAAS